MFVILAVIMILSSIGTVVTKSIIRAATYLLFVLLGTAGMYFLMGYTFLGAVQTMVYAGGIIVLYVFAILLTEGKDGAVKSRVKDASWGLILTLVGFPCLRRCALQAKIIRERCRPWRSDGACWCRNQ